MQIYMSVQPLQLKLLLLNLKVTEQKYTVQCVILTVTYLNGFYQKTYLLTSEKTCLMHHCLTFKNHVSPQLIDTHWHE